MKKVVCTYSVAIFMPFVMKNPAGDDVASRAVRSPEREWLSEKDVS